MPRLSLASRVCCSRARPSLGVATFQYKHGDIAIAKPAAAEPRIARFAVTPAIEYLDNGALAWARDQKCVWCHTTGTYLLVRPQLPAKFGKPSQEIYDFFISQLAAKKTNCRARRCSSARGK